MNVASPTHRVLAFNEMHDNHMHGWKQGLDLFRSIPAHPDQCTIGEHLLVQIHHIAPLHNGMLCTIAPRNESKILVETVKCLPSVKVRYNEPAAFVRAAMIHRDAHRTASDSQSQGGKEVSVLRCENHREHTTRFINAWMCPCLEASVHWKSP